MPDVQTSLHDKPDDPLDLHHIITESCNNPIQLASFLSSNMQDPAAKVSKLTLPVMMSLT